MILAGIHRTDQSPVNFAFSGLEKSMAVNCLNATIFCRKKRRPSQPTYIRKKAAEAVHTGGILPALDTALSKSCVR